MADKKMDFKSFVEKQNAERVKAEAKVEKTKHELEQIEHQAQRALNRADFIQGKRTKMRNKRLIDKGIAVEAVIKDTELMTSQEFFTWFEALADDPNVISSVKELTVGRREAFEQEQQELHELQMEAAAVRRKRKKE